MILKKSQCRVSRSIDPIIVLNLTLNRKHVTIIKMHRDVQRGTLVKYSRMVSKAVGFALSCSLASDCEFNAPLNTEQRSVCAELLQVMDAEHSPNTPITNLFDEDIEDTEEDEEDEDEDIDDGDPQQDPPIADLPMLFQQYVQMDPQAERNPSSNQIFVCPIVQPIITRLFVSLATHLPSTATDGKWFNLFLPFIVLASIRKKGEFIPADQITQIISAILFLLRLTMFNLMDTHVTNDPTERYEA
jgi:hypothetical protein